MNPNKVVILRTNSAISEPRVVKESNALSGAGFNVVLLAWAREQVPKINLLNENVGIKTLKLNAPFGSRLLLFFFPIYWLWASIQSLISKPGIIHACDLDTVAVGLIAKLFHPTTVLIYDCFEYYPGMISPLLISPLKHLIASIDRVCAGIADYVIIPNEERRRFYSNAKRVIILPNTPKTIKIIGQKKEEFTVFYGGGLDFDRGIVTLLKSAANLSNVAFVIAGDGPLKRTVEQFRSRYPNIKYLGYMPNEELITEMSQSHVSVAFYEACNENNIYAASSKVFDSMMTGVPVITNKECISSKIISKNNCGLVVPYGDVNSLTQAITKLRDNRKLCEVLGDNGRMAFTKYYSWETVSRNFINEYKSIARNN